MNKLEIIDKLNNLKLDPSRFVVISGASLVLHDIIKSTDDIDMACDRKYYDCIDWNKKTRLFWY